MIKLDSAILDWHIPELPVELRGNTCQKPDVEAARTIILQQLLNAASDRSRVQIAAADWLYRLVRSNIKRGRAFELGEALSARRADCLVYARLFSALGRKFGLELGIIEVLIDNAGRYVPHHVNLLNLPDGTRRFIDAWYGSTDINHRRIAALVAGRPEDIDSMELSRIHDIKGLPDYCIKAIILYIKGNRCLERDELDEAIKYYSGAIDLYPNNSRAFFNRAIAHERKGVTAEAELDYARALKDESSLIRVLAGTDELESLIVLDEKGISEEEQDIYLWHKGFKTGAPAGYGEIGIKFGIPPEEIKKIILKVKVGVQAD